MHLPVRQKRLVRLLDQKSVRPDASRYEASVEYAMVAWECNGVCGGACACYDIWNMTKDKRVTIFGYGSLMNMESLRKTVPDVGVVTPALLEGYVRVFNTESLFTFTENGKMYAVLNVAQSPGTVMNGVCFEVTQEYIDDLLEREEGYDLREVRVQSCIDGREFDAVMFIDVSGKVQDFVFNDAMQMGYLQTCADGARAFGEEFYERFLDTTLIGGKKAGEIEGLLG